MRSTSLFSITAGLGLVMAGALGAACGGDDDGGADANNGSGSGGGGSGSGSGTAPRVLDGGGIDDGPIDGVANVYAIDDATRTPVAGASVTVGTATGVTDATGLFVATGVHGKQTVLITAGGYRSELWIGANGTNITVDLQKTALQPGQANLTGKVDMTSVTVGTGHNKTAAVTYSQDDVAGDAANNLPQTANTCEVSSVSPTQSCTFTVTSRAGHVALIAAILDHNTKGTPTPTDDTFALVGWAFRTNIVVVAGTGSGSGDTDQVNQDLTTVADADTLTETIDFGTPPSNLPVVAGVIGMELGASGVAQLPSLVALDKPTLKVPKLSALGAASYRLSAVAKASTEDDVASSVVLVRGQTGTTLTAGAWLPVASGITVSRTSAAWTAVPGATVQSLLLSGKSDLLNVTSFDGTTSFAIPAAAAVPASGDALTAKVTAISAPGLDVTHFSLDADRGKLAAVSSAPAQVAN